MAEAFGIGAGIVGVIGLAIQITQVVVQFGLDWKDAPNEVKTFLAELQTLKTVLSETNTNILLNSDFAEAFQNRSSLLLSQLGTGAPSTTSTKLMLAACQRELESLLGELKKRAKGHRVGWERFKGAFLAKNTREAVENLHRQCQTLNSLVMIDATVLGATTYKEVKEARKEHLEWHQTETDQEILTWLTTTDYGAQQSDFLSQRQEGTGRWLLDSDEFRRWSNGDIQTLFCQGMPGAGKTIMASIVIDHLYKYQNDDRIGIAYLYCNFRRQHEQSPVDLFASLLKQLIQRLPSMPQSVKTLYKDHKDKQTRLSFGEISKELHSVVADYSRTFIIIDALDECQVSDGGRKRLLSEIFYLQMKTGVSLFTTSRFIPEIMKEFEGSVSLEIRASDEDVQRYIDGHMSQLPSFVLRNPDLQEDIRMEITKAVDGMFLLAQLHLGSLIGKRSPKAIRIALEKLPKGSEAYDHAYNEAMERIEGQVADSQELARQVLTWITCARRPLTTLELRHALAVEVGESELDNENLPEIEDMVSVCAGLVTVDEESEIIRLVHYTTQEYFERTWKSWFPDAQNSIAVSCVTYLLFDNFESGFCLTDQEFEARLRSNPLYDYAARNWGHHAHAAATELEQSILDLLESHTKLSACSQAMMASKRYLIGSHYSQDVPREMAGAHLAAYFGLRQTMVSLLESGHEPNGKDTYGQTPLSWAARNGHEVVVKLLLQKDGVDLDSKDTNCQRPGLWIAQNEHEAAARLLVASEGSHRVSKRMDGWTPLLWAAINGHEAVVRLLLEKDAIDPDFKDGSIRTPLSWAAINGHEAVAKLLLGKDGVDPDPKDIHRRTPLWYAAERGHDAVVNLLLSKDGVNPDSKDWLGVRPLWRAAQNGHTAVVKLLLGKDGVDPDSRDTNGRTPLSWAAMNAHKEVVKLLLARDGSDPDPRDTNGQTPLRYAAERGHDVIVSLLISKDGVNPDSEDNVGVRPLWRASQNGHKAVVKLLLGKDGVNPDSKDIRGRTPLSWATMNGHEAVMRLLLEKDDVDPDSKDINNRTPLSWAAQNGHETLVKLLTENSVDLDFKDANGRTPLSWAAQNGHEAVVLLLLTKDSVDPDSKDINGQTPLSWAAKSGHEAVVKLLLAKDNVNPNSKDTKFSQTPLSWAAEAGHDTIVELFLAEDDVNVNLKDANGRTPLWCAAEGGHTTVVKLLLTKESIDLESRDVQGQTPLSRAAQNGHEAVIRLLLAQDIIDPDSKDRVGRTPLSWAAENGHKEVVKLLLGKDGIDSDSKDYEYGRTPLSWAAASGRESVVKLLLAEDGVDPDSKDKINRTPLLWAAQNGWGAAVEVVELLLANDGVKPHSKDKYGQTPLSWAVKKVQEAAKALPAEGGIDREPQATIAQDRWRAAVEVVELLLAKD